MVEKTPVTSRLSVRLSPELKRVVEAQAKEAGVPVAEWVRIRLEFEDATPANVAAFLKALCTLGANARRVFQHVDENHAAFVASQREQPAREAEIRERVLSSLKRDALSAKDAS